jgi:Family of unknown function (DUF6496)
VARQTEWQSKQLVMQSCMSAICILLTEAERRQEVQGSLSSETDLGARLCTEIRSPEMERKKRLAAYSHERRLPSSRLSAIPSEKASMNYPIGAFSSELSQGRSFDACKYDRIPWCGPARRRLSNRWQELTMAPRKKSASSRKTSKSASKDVESAMRRRKKGTLKSGSGKKVTSKKQAIAIGLSEARKKGKKVSRKSSWASPREGRVNTS